MTLFVPFWRFRCSCILIIGLAAIFFSGCASQNTYPPPQPPPPEVIGHIEATGPNVQYNHRPTRGGHTVRSGDNVSTGANSRATIRLTGGGVVTLDEETDPEFIKEAWCILVKILEGQVHTEGPGICFETPHARGMINSEVNIKVTNQESIITVLKGSVNIKQPFRLRLNPFNQVRVVKGRIDPIRSLSKSELRSVFRWIRILPGDGAESNSERCKSYAKTAVSQQNDNQRRRCGFNGARWSTNYKGHYEWCMQVPQSTADNEDQARNRELKYECSAAVAQPDPRKRCNQYAKTAVSQQNDNQRRRCGFNGARWSTNYKGHYEWCMQVPQSTADNENQARNRELKYECSAAVAQPDPRKRCNQYAKTAISQQNENLRRRCRLNGNEWSRDFNHHYRWCVQVPQSRADAGTLLRSKALRKCPNREPKIY